MFDAPMTVREALERAMASSNFWVCKVVASAHPDQALVEVGGRIPALWLAKNGPWPKAGRDLMGTLTPAQRERAILDCSKSLARKVLESIHPCMIYQHQMPVQSRMRRLRREAKLAKELSRLISWAGKGEGSLAMGLAKESARLGISLAQQDFGGAYPHCRIWVKDLGWDDLAESALARAERKWLAKESSEQPLATSPGAARL